MTDSDPGQEKGRIQRMLLPMAMRYGPIRQGIGMHSNYRKTGGSLIVGGLAYAALFALIPTVILVMLGLSLLIDDPSVRQEAIDIVNRAFPALEGVTEPAVAATRQIATIGSLFALIGFAWGASGLYLNLTRAMERFFPGERVSGMLARVLGVLIVVLVIVAVLAVVIVAGVLTVVTRALGVDAQWVLTVAGGVLALALATGLAYGIYRVMPANPPTAHSARLPALAVGIVIAAMTLFYGLISPWLVSGFAAFGVMASVFVALVWLRVVFMAMIYGAAAARYRDYVAMARHLGESEPDDAATRHIIELEQSQADAETRAAKMLDLGERGSSDGD
ncbi:MAG: YhjD/YihY/BrkB family envelope integrity protein [Chloroflexota bacterium]